MLLAMVCVSQVEASFKIRFGENGTESADLFMGADGAPAATATVKVKRYMDLNDLSVTTSWQIVEGDPAHWDIQLLAGPLMLGPAPTTWNLAIEPKHRENNC
jgi:hypothetical protein